MLTTAASLATRNAVIGQLVALLAEGEFEKLSRFAPRSRVTTQEIVAVVKQYGRRLLPLPEHAFQFIDYIAVDITSPIKWSVVVPLYTEEEGRSDLSLEITMVEAGPSQYEVHIDDIHVL